MGRPAKDFLFRHVIARYPPSAFVLAVQAVLLVFYAVYGDVHSHRAVISAFGALVPALAIWVVSRSPALNWIAWVLAVPTFVLSLLSVQSENPALVATSSLLEAMLYFYTAGSLIAYMMQDMHVTADDLFAAGATFTLIAWGFAHSFLVCQLWSHGSFIGIRDPAGPRLFLELLFLSFSNLSSVGLGDILPLTAPARVLVMVEQFAGVAYIAVVVSRLIGLTIVHQGRR